MQRRDTRRVAARTARHSRLTHACDLATKVSVLNVFEKKKHPPSIPDVNTAHTFLLEDELVRTSLHVTCSIHEVLWEKATLRIPDGERRRTTLCS